MNKPILKWSPTLAIRKPDNIVSSHAKPAFKPSYENEAENMNFIMSNEYMRMWFKEKQLHEKDTYARDQIIKKERKIKRRMIQRMMTYRKPSKNHFIDDLVQRQMGQNKGKDQEQMKKKMKFKPACLPSQIEGKIKSKTKDHGSSKTKDGEENECIKGCCEIAVCPITCRQNG